MKYLMEQAEFETLIGRGEYPDAEVPPYTVVYFTANWCGACRAIDVNALMEAHPNVNWLKCDVDQNNYTAGYCSIRSIPSFIAVKNKKIAGTLQSNNNAKILEWVSACNVD
jgi:thioredoxin-like negative regulator of GroEL